MSDLGWRADGIARARAAGGIELEVYRRPGFTGGIGVRRSKVDGDCYGIQTSYDPDPPDDEDE
jgi:hypothetical protein